jgi:hypothetical protein
VDYSGNALGIAFQKIGKSRMNTSKKTAKLAKPGELITFGSYPQTPDGTEKLPIQWRVLGNSGSELFLLSEYILDCKRYHGDYEAITWRDCDLRKWLNDEFYNSAFTATEEELIQTSHCTSNGENSPDTEDKVFLLSVAEVTAFTEAQGGGDTGLRRRAIGTEFAKLKKSDGCHLYVYDKGVEKDYIVGDGVKHGCSWWWLRTQGNTSSRAFFVGARSSIRSYGRVNLARDGVRPAIKLNLQ